MKNCHRPLSRQKPIVNQSNSFPQVRNKTLLFSDSFAFGKFRFEHSLLQAKQMIEASKFPKQKQLTPCIPRGDKLPISKLVVVKLISENIDRRIQLSHNQCSFFLATPLSFVFPFYSDYTFDSSTSNSNSLIPVFGFSMSFLLIGLSDEFPWLSSFDSIYNF